MHTFDVLESMAAWLRDTTDRQSSGRTQFAPEQWRFVAMLLLAGKHYE
jgi:hypothetical protein